MAELKQATIITLPNTIAQTVTLQTPDGLHIVVLQRLSSGAVQATVDGVLVGDAKDGPILREILKLA